MESKTLRTLTVLFIIAICAYVLYPSIKWHFLTTEDEKTEFVLSRDELRKRKANLDNKIEKIKGFLPYRQKRLEHEGELIFNLRPKEGEILQIGCGKTDVITDAVFKGKLAQYKDEFTQLHKEACQLEFELARSKEYTALRVGIVKLGLDLAGGVHLTIDVDKKDLVRNLQKYFEARGLIDKNTANENVAAGKVADPDKLEIIEDVVRTEIKNDEEKNLSGDELEKEVKKQSDKLIKDYQLRMENDILNATDNALTIIRERIDKFGVSETTITKGLGDRIYIELPKLDPKEVETTINAITEAGNLAFQLVDEKLMKLVPYKYRVASGDKRGYISSGHVIAATEDRPYPVLKDSIRLELEQQGIKLSTAATGSNLYPYEETDEFGTPQVAAYVILKNKIQVEGKLLNDASIGYSQQGTPEVNFEFGAEGAVKFGKITGANIGNRLAIVLDGKVKSDPRINAMITNRGTISLGNNPNITDEVKKLTAILKAGVLPAKLNVVSVMNIDAKLGKDNIRSGLMAVAVGMAIVILFMMIYYKLAGVMAVIALSLNLFFLFSILSAFGFTLTLPGIAGIILTIGMAVDANVIIFERLKEEVKLGRSREAAIIGGYEKAFSAIFDSNLTTILAAFILSQIGSGVIKGFGFTLMWGIICSMFTALFVTRLLMDYVTVLFKPKSVSV